LIETHLESRTKTLTSLHLAPLTAESIAPFGEMILAPAEVGERSFYTQWLGSERSEMTPRLHVNYVRASTLPMIIDTLEQHPHSAQIFLPLDVARYLIVVAPSDELGNPDLAHSEAFLAPGNVGIVYRPGVWHAGAAVLDRPGSFGVLMWRNDTADDEVFRQLSTSLRVHL